MISPRLEANPSVPASLAVIITSHIRLPALVLMTLCGISNTASAAEEDPFSLGAAMEFAVIGSTTITNTGDTILSGKHGVTPGTAVTGITTPQSDAFAAKSDAGAAYNTVKNATSTNSYTDAANIGGLTLTPGVHTFPSSVFITGDLTLDFQGNPDAAFLFQIGSTLITAAGPGASSVKIKGGGSAQNIFWQVGSSATISTYTEFSGNIVALTSIAMKTGATLDGRSIALNGAVTLESNLVRSATGGGSPSGGGGGPMGSGPSLPGVPAVPASILIGLCCVCCARAYFKKKRV